MDQKIPYDDYQLPVVFLPSYESPPAWIAPQEVRLPNAMSQTSFWMNYYKYIYTHTILLNCISSSLGVSECCHCTHGAWSGCGWRCGPRAHYNVVGILMLSLLLMQRIHHPDYNNELTQFLPRTVVLKKPPGAQLGFNIRGGKASQLGIFISKVCVGMVDNSRLPSQDNHRIRVSLHVFHSPIYWCFVFVGGPRIRCSQGRTARGWPGPLCQWGGLPRHRTLKGQSCNESLNTVKNPWVVEN